MKSNKLYCGTCGESVGASDGAIKDYIEVCPKCGTEFSPKDIKRVAMWGLFPGGGQCANGDFGKAIGIVILTAIVFMIGLPLFIIGGFIFATFVVLSADLAAMDRATRYAGYSKEAPTIYNTNQPLRTS